MNPDPEAVPALAMYLARITHPTDSRPDALVEYVALAVTIIDDLLSAGFTIKAPSVDHDDNGYLTVIADAGVDLMVKPIQAVAALRRHPGLTLSLYEAKLVVDTLRTERVAGYIVEHWDPTADRWELRRQAASHFDISVNDHIMVNALGLASERAKGVAR